MSKQRLEQKQYQKLSPQQIQFLGLLQIPIVSLEKRIEEELEDNPALEEDEENQTYFSSDKTDFSDFQIEDKSESLTSYLEKQLVGNELSESNLFLVKYLINSLDSNGFLSRDLFSISSDLLISDNLDISEVMMVNALNVLQDLDPIGVGAKNLQECLLIQLKKIYPENKLALKIMTEFYSQFSNKNFENLIKNLDISEEKLKSTYSLIESLNPIPSNGFFKNEEIAEYIYPDFTVLVVNNQLELQLNKSNTKPIKISKYYSKLLKETSDKTTKEFLQEKIEKALWFKEALIKREDNIKKSNASHYFIPKKLSFKWSRE